MRAWTSYILAIRPAVRSGSVVVGDRWLYGYAAQPLALKFYGPEWVARLMLRLMPQPDLVMVLDAPAEVIRERKELQQRVDLVCRDLVGSYRDLAERFVGFRDTATGTPD